MSRVIKFRAIKFRAFNRGKMTQISPSTGELDTIQGDIHLMQYTGLKDSYGKEIFEGDIIHWKEEGIVFEIKWSVEDCGYICIRYHIEDGGCSSGSMNQMYLDHFEIIGNIHENPELLEVAR